jgi:hypothetical protein
MFSVLYFDRCISIAINKSDRHESELYVCIWIYPINDIPDLISLSQHVVLNCDELTDGWLSLDAYVRSTEMVVPV